MDSWRSHSNPGLQTAVAVLCAVTGLILVIGFRNFQGPGLSNSVAGFVLGAGLLFLGVLAFIFSGPQTIVVDPRTRQITIEDKTRFGVKTRVIAFGEIERVDVAFSGSHKNHVKMYHLSLRLKDGKKYPLFAPGRFYEGASNQAVVECWKMRLEEHLSQPRS